ncbi:VENN motif pre-toxin domain-containing protein [Pantoea sp.]|uniref:VENN motif pre-toxin domain-containing protein n=1 Tax=Pantoea sp. TaxID=69393 RepID=UPI0039180454
MALNAIVHAVWDTVSAQMSGGNGAAGAFSLDLATHYSINAGKVRANGNGLSLNAGRDTTLTGAQVRGDSVKVDTGRNLTLTSEQDSDRYDSKQQSASAGGSFTFGSMTGSANVNVSRDKMHSNWQSVAEQTGIFAGKGGFDVKVGEHTQLNGAVIASTADASLNKLDTGTLGFSDIENHADYEVEHQSAGMSTGGSIGGNFAGNMANGMLAGLNDSGSADSVTRSAVSESTIVIRDKEKQAQDVADLSRDVQKANPGLDVIFDKEKEQSRLKAAQLIGEIGSQAGDIARTQGDIIAMREANAKMSGATQTDRDRALAELKAKDPAKQYSADDVSKQVYSNFYNQAFVDSGFGTGGKVQRAISAVTAAVQGLAGGNLAQAVSGAAAPYLATEIHRLTEGNPEAQAMAHAVLGAVSSYASGNSALAGAAGGVSGELMAKLVMKQLYPGKAVGELSEPEKQTISALGTLAAVLAGGVTGDSTAGAVAGAQAGKNAVENNFLGATSSDKLDKAIEKIKNGDKSLATANELIKLENADKRSDALVSKFTKDPTQMNSTERAELAGYLRIYASEMEKAYGPAVAQQLVTGLLSGQDYIKRNPDSEAMSKAQSIMNTWGYHKSNASIGDVPLMFGSSVLGLTVKGMAANAAIGVGVNSAAQLAGKDPFSYVDAIMAGATAAATTGKGVIISTPINMGGAAIGSIIKGEDPTNSVIGTGLGSVFGGGVGKVISGSMGSTVKEGTSDIISNIGGSITSEAVGNVTKGALDEADETTKKQ